MLESFLSWFTQPHPLLLGFLIGSLLTMIYQYVKQDKKIRKMQEEEREHSIKWREYFQKEYEEAIARDNSYVEVMFVGNSNLSDSMYARQKVEEELAKKGFDMNKIMVLPYYVEYAGKIDPSTGRLNNRVKLPRVQQ